MAQKQLHRDDDSIFGDDEECEVSVRRRKRQKSSTGTGGKSVAAPSSAKGLMVEDSCCHLCSMSLDGKEIGRLQGLSCGKLARALLVRRQRRC